MDITTSSVAQAYRNAQSAAGPGADDQTGGAGEAFAHAARDFARTLHRGEAAAQAVMTGDADPYALVQALSQTQLAIETAVTVRDKVVEAYQEILRMPV